MVKVDVLGKGAERPREYSFDLRSFLRSFTLHHRTQVMGFRLKCVCVCGGIYSEQSYNKTFLLYFTSLKTYVCIQYILIISTFHPLSTSPTHLPANFITIFSIIIIFNLLNSISASHIHMAVSMFCSA